jgi:hypothetical protein
MELNVVFVPLGPFAAKSNAPGKEPPPAPITIGCGEVGTVVGPVKYCPAPPPPAI